MYLGDEIAKAIFAKSEFNKVGVWSIWDNRKKNWALKGVHHGLVEHSLEPTQRKTLMKLLDCMLLDQDTQIAIRTVDANLIAVPSDDSYLIQKLRYSAGVRGPARPLIDGDSQFGLMES